MHLLIDIGNTRIKWATLQRQRLSQQQAALYANWTATQIRQQIFKPIPRPTSVLIANVAGPDIAALLSDTISSVYGIQPEFVQANNESNGVRNGYTTPTKLGTDRWLALIAAYHLERRAACVVSVGTAMTVDAIDAKGQHLGGFIAPGPDLMITSLLTNTSDIANRAVEGDTGGDIFAKNTLAAVHQGAIHSLAAAIERACAELRARLDVMPALILTGGASERVAAQLHMPYRHISDLVLRGLAEIARTTK
jgi:type III pantothenate kinase